LGDDKLVLLGEENACDGLAPILGDEYIGMSGSMPLLLMLLLQDVDDGSFLANPISSL
jgi:hypothetical protein